MSTDKDKMILARLQLAAEIRIAHSTFPDLPLSSAFLKWKSARGESADISMIDHIFKLLPRVPARNSHLFERPCTRVGCQGTQKLEGICRGCIEGQAGYKTKWTCRKCLHRDLSKEDLNEWLTGLSSG